MTFNVFAKNIFVGTLRITRNGCHRFRNRLGEVVPSRAIKLLGSPNLRRY